MAALLNHRFIKNELVFNIKLVRQNDKFSCTDYKKSKKNLACAKPLVEALVVLRVYLPKLILSLSIKRRVR